MFFTAQIMPVCNDKCCHLKFMISSYLQFLFFSTSSTLFKLQPLQHKGLMTKTLCFLLRNGVATRGFRTKNYMGVPVLLGVKLFYLVWWYVFESWFTRFGLRKVGLKALICASEFIDVSRKIKNLSRKDTSLTVQIARIDWQKIMDYWMDEYFLRYRRPIANRHVIRQQ